MMRVLAFILGVTGGIVLLAALAWLVLIFAAVMVMPHGR